jgi:kynurenine formamidase
MTDLSVHEKLASTIVSARVVDLGQPYFNGMPVHPEDPPFLFYLYRYHEHTKDIFMQKAPGFSDSMELITTSMHSGTHLDALCHMSRNGILHGGVNAAELETHKGYKRMGIEEAPPFVRRAVLLDIPTYKGVDILPERYAITPGDLEAAMKKEGVDVRPGDVALVRTGYSRYFQSDSNKYLHDFAGVTLEGARWLASKKISLTGIDNLAYGVPLPFEVHLTFLVDNGIYMMKSMNLEELSKLQAYVSTLIVTPLKVLGGTGSLVRPIALVPS